MTLLRLQDDGWPYWERWMRYQASRGASVDVEALAELDELRRANASMRELLEDARSYVPPTTATHEEITETVGWCDCGYCTDVPKERP